MTNEQTALLIEQYRRQLVDIYNRLEEDLKDGVEYHQKRGEWIGEEEKPKVNLDTLDGFDVLWDDKNWSWIDTSKPLCLDDLSSFIGLLDDDVESLTE